MPYYYDQLISLSKKMGKSLEKVAEDMSIPYSTVRKWKTRNPHDKYKAKINKYLNDHRSYLTLHVEHETDVGSPGAIIPPDIAVNIEYDEDGIPKGFWNELEQIYKAHPDGEENWKREVNALKEIIKSIADALKPKYTVYSPIRHGGVSVVIKVRNNELNVTRALKVPRPIADRHDVHPVKLDFFGPPIC